MISNGFPTQIGLQTLFHTRTRNLIKRFNGIKDYDPLLPLIWLTLGLFRLTILGDDFYREETNLFVGTRAEPVVMGHEARLLLLIN